METADGVTVDVGDEVWKVSEFYETKREFMAKRPSYKLTRFLLVSAGRHRSAVGQWDDELHAMVLNFVANGDLYADEGCASSSMARRMSERE